MLSTPRYDSNASSRCAPRGPGVGTGQRPATRGSGGRRDRAARPRCSLPSPVCACAAIPSDRPYPGIGQRPDSTHAVVLVRADAVAPGRDRLGAPGVAAAHAPLALVSGDKCRHARADKPPCRPIAVTTVELFPSDDGTGSRRSAALPRSGSHPARSPDRGPCHEAISR